MTKLPGNPAASIDNYKMEVLMVLPQLQCLDKDEYEVTIYTVVVR